MSEKIVMAIRMQRRLKLLALVLAGVLLATVPSSSSLSVEPPSVSQTRLERTRDQDLGFLADRHLLRRPEQYDDKLRVFERLRPKMREWLLGRERAWDPRRAVTEAVQQVNLSKISPVVQIAAFLDRMALGPGSGTLIHPSGLILTNSHVVRKGPGGCGVTVQGDLGSLFVVLVTEEGKEDQPPVPKFTAALVAEDPQLDVALLRIDRQVEGLKDLKELKEAVAQNRLRTASLPPDLKLPHWNLWDSRVLKEESRVLAWGYPAEEIPKEQLPRLELSRGPIFTLKPPEGPQHLFIDKLFTIPGISGGPVVDPRTDLIVGVVCGRGIPTKPTKPAEELTKAVLANEIQELLQKVPQHINRYPVADFKWEPRNPEVGDLVILDASPSFDFDGSIKEYEWDFNSDGKPDASGVTVSFKVHSPEDVSVTLTVKDNENASNSQTKRVILQREQTCKARIGEREYDSIGEAIKEAKPGDTITISEGQCQEDVVIAGKQDLTIKGEKGQEKTTLFGTGTAPVIAIQDSQGITIEGLTIRDGLVGLLVQSSSAVIVRQNAVMQNLGRGISLMDAAGAKIEQNVIEANGEEGLQVRGAPRGKPVEVRGNKISENEQGGVLIRENVRMAHTLKVVLTDNAIERNELVGVAITHFSAAEISGGKITETKADVKGRFGIGLEINSSRYEAVTIAAITVSSNEATGIEIKGASREVTITGSTISGNQYVGIFLRDSAQATITSSQISRNWGNGISMWDSARATITDSQISDNGRAGIFMGDSAQATLTNSQLSGNGDDGIFIVGSAQATITGSQISGNGYGIEVRDSAMVTLINSQALGNADSGLYVSKSAMVEVKDAWISDNGSCGISRHGSAKVAGRNNWVWHNAENFCSFSPPEDFLRPYLNPPWGTFLDSAEVCPRGCQFSEVGPAVWRLKPGGTLKIQAGTYRGGVVLVKNLILEGAGREQTVLTGSIWAGILVAGAAQVYLKDLQVFDNRVAGLWVFNSAQVSLTNIHLSSNGWDGLWVEGSAQVVLTNVHLFSNRRRYGLSVWDSGRVSLINSTIFGNGRDGLLMADLAVVVVQGSAIAGNGISPDCQKPGPSYLLILECNGIEIWDQTKLTLIDSVIIGNTDWGLAARLKKCGEEKDFFTGKVEFQNMDLDKIKCNNRSSNQDGKGNPGNHPWNRPDIPDGQVCLP